jgi:hypothetical protein
MTYRIWDSLDNMISLEADTPADAYMLACDVLKHAPVYIEEVEE